MKQGLTGSQLKWIAIVTMAIDHIGAIFIEQGILRVQDTAYYDAMLMTSVGNAWAMMDMILRMIGRFAFPIFAFLLVEGFLHTRNRTSYALRLMGFAFLSEVPFDLAFSGTWMEGSSQNVFFTLSLGLFTIWLWETYKGKGMIQILILFLGCCIAEFIHSDYSYIGILMIFCFYFFHERIMLRNASVGVLLFIETWFMLGVGVLALIPIQLYNKQRGRTKSKYFFYLFYPLHLLLFSFLLTMF